MLRHIQKPVEVSLEVAVQTGLQFHHPRTSDNTVAANETIVGTVCNAAKIPVYTSYSGAICYASLAIDYYQLGYRTGEMAAEILLGNKTVADFEIETLTPTVQYNKELCATLGIAVPTEN